MPLQIGCIEGCISKKGRLKTVFPLSDDLPLSAKLISAADACTPAM
ncbi:hypothetical protein MCC93_01150 [Morococcus cerebrosus]|uniref:Uncharacterized protein n=1 Tax=Morococcus cerebrosus TaxID=1056807 RepID=A0A0C1ELY4_9NEIS|nr:hypothetical protein MCC93_01150 [Morococcus cerebrosus]